MIVSRCVIATITIMNELLEIMGRGVIIQKYQLHADDKLSFFPKDPGDVRDCVLYFNIRG